MISVTLNLPEMVDLRTQKQRAEVVGPLLALFTHDKESARENFFKPEGIQALLPFLVALGVTYPEDRFNPKYARGISKLTPRLAHLQTMQAELDGGHVCDDCDGEWKEDMWNEFCGLFRDSVAMWITLAEPVEIEA